MEFKQHNKNCLVDVIQGCNKLIEYTDTKKYDEDESSLKCNQCNKAFSNIKLLEMHSRIHNGDKPYPCSQCDKAFINNSSLKRHTKTHTGEKAHHCSQYCKTLI
ncbi:unnamed protein product, partial [Meganyctiphanes norvegica]